MDIAVDGFRIGLAAIQEPGLLALLRRQPERFDQFVLRRIVAVPEAGLVEYCRESLEMVQGPRAERGPDLPEGVPGGLPERRARERFEQPTPEVQGDGLVEGEGEPGLVAVALDPPGLSATVADGLLQGKADAPKDLQVAADRAFCDAQLVDHLADRQSPRRRDAS